MTGRFSRKERMPEMKIAAIYDIHGNLPALEAVLSDIEREGVDVIVVGGDMVPGPMPREVIELLLSLGDRVNWIRGNCEREIVAAFDGSKSGEGQSAEGWATTVWTAGQLERRHRDFLAGLPEKISYSLEGED